MRKIVSFDYEKSIWGKADASLNWSNPTNIRLRRLLKALVKEKSGSRVLEVGCGAGSFIKALKSARPELECFGTDISSEAIGQAKSMKDGVNYRQCTESALPYEEDEFDVVFFFDVLEHVSWPENFLIEIKRVLKRSGKIFVFVPCEKDFLSAWNILDKFGLKNDLTKIFAGHINIFTRKDVEKVLDKVGFYIIDKSYSEHFFGQIIGLIAFYGMQRMQKISGEHLNNEKYFRELSVRKGAFFKFFKYTVNSLVTLESILLSRLPSPNYFIRAVKK